MVTITITAKIRKPGTAFVALGTAVAVALGTGAVTDGADARPQRCEVDNHR